MPQSSDAPDWDSLQPVGKSDYEQIARQTAQQYGVDPDFVSRIGKQESGWNPQAKSPKGAMGVMQLMPGTAQRYGVNPADPVQNIQGGVRYLADLHKKYNGDQRLMAAAYNAGEGAVARFGNTIPPYKETRNYVAQVAGKQQKAPDWDSLTPVGQAPTQPAAAPNWDAMQPVQATPQQVPQTASQQAAPQPVQSTGGIKLIDEPNFGHGTADVAKAAQLGKAGYTAGYQVDVRDLAAGLKAGTMKPEDAIAELRRRQEQTILGESGVSPKEFEAIKKRTGATGLLTPGDMQDELQRIQSGQPYQFQAPAATAQNLQYQRRLAQYEGMSAQDKANEAVDIAKTRRLTAEERQALGVQDSNVFDRIGQSLVSGVSSTMGKLASGVGAKDFGQKAQEGSRALQNLYGEPGQAGRIAQMAGSLGPEMAGTIALPESRLAHMAYWGLLSGTKARGEGKSWKDAATDAAQAVVMLEAGKPLGPLKDEVGDAFTAQATKLGSRAALGYASGYALARAQGATKEDAENQGMQFAAMSALPGKQLREKALSIRPGETEAPQAQPEPPRGTVEPTETPRYVYRTRDVGEEGVPTAGHAQATTSEEQARSYISGRESVQGKPQEVVRVDLNKLSPEDYETKPHPSGTDWIKFNKPLPESAVERMPQQVASHADTMAQGSVNSLSEARKIKFMAEHGGREPTPDEIANFTHDDTLAARQIQREAVDKWLAPDSGVNKIVIVAGEAGGGKSTAITAQERANEPGTKYFETHYEDLPTVEHVLRTGQQNGKEMEVVNVHREDSPEDVYKKTVERAEKTGKVVGPEYGADLARSFYGNLGKVARVANETGAKVKGVLFKDGETTDIVGKYNYATKMPADLEDRFREQVRGSKYERQFLEQGRPGGVQVGPEAQAVRSGGGSLPQDVIQTAGGPSQAAGEGGEGAPKGLEPLSQFNPVGKYYYSEGGDLRQVTGYGKTSSGADQLGFRSVKTGQTGEHGVQPGRNIQLFDSPEAAEAGLRGQNAASAEIRRRAYEGSAQAREGSIPTEGRTVQEPRQIGEPERITGIKNAATEAERAERGLDPIETEARKGLGTSLDEGKALLAEHTDFRQQVRDWADKPRTLSDAEEGALLTDRMQLHNQSEELLKQAKAAMDAKDTDRLSEINAKLQPIQQALLENDAAAKATGTQWGRSGRARQMMMKQDYSLTNNTLKWRAANGGKELTEAQTRQIADLTDKLRAAEAKLKENDRSASRLAAQQAVAKEARQARRQSRQVDRVSLAAEYANLSKQFGQAAGKVSANPLFDPELYSIIGKIVRNRAQAGVNTVQGMVDAVKEAIKDHIDPSVTDRDIRDAISGYGKPPSQTKSEIQQQIAQLKQEARQVSRQEDIRAGEKTGRTPTQAESQKRNKTYYENRIAELQGKLDRKEYTKPQRQGFQPNPENQRLKAQVGKLQQQIDQGAARIELANRSKPTKVRDFLVRMRVQGAISGVTTMGKVATDNLFWRQIEQHAENIAGAGLTKIAPKLAAKAGGEAVPSLGRTEARTFASQIKGLRDLGRAFTFARQNPQSELQTAYGKINPKDMPPSLLDMAVTLHRTVQTPLEQTAFDAAYGNQMDALKKGDPSIDTNDPAVVAQVIPQALAISQERILNANNALNNKIRNLFVTKGGGGEAVRQIIQPVMKRPLNYLKQVGEYHPVTGTAQVLWALRKGIANMDADTAAKVMRIAKRSAGVGAAMMAWGWMRPQDFGGYYQPGEHRKEGDIKAGQMKVAGITIPAWLARNPAFEIAQMTATSRRLYDYYAEKGRPGVMSGAAAATRAAAGMAQEVPFLEDIGSVAGAASEPRGANAGERLEKGAGQAARNVLIPPDVQKLASPQGVIPQLADREKTGEARVRQPRTFGEELKMGVPGLRQTVPQSIDPKAAKILTDAGRPLPAPVRQVRINGKTEPLSGKQANDYRDRFFKASGDAMRQFESSKMFQNLNKDEQAFAVHALMNKIGQREQAASKVQVKPKALDVIDWKMKAQEPLSELQMDAYFDAIKEFRMKAPMAKAQ